MRNPLAVMVSSMLLVTACGVTTPAVDGTATVDVTTTTLPPTTTSSEPPPTTTTTPERVDDPSRLFDDMTEAMAATTTLKVEGTMTLSDTATGELVNSSDLVAVVDDLGDMWFEFRTADPAKGVDMLVERSRWVGDTYYEIDAETHKWTEQDTGPDSPWVDAIFGLLTIADLSAEETLNGYLLTGTGYGPDAWDIEILLDGATDRIIEMKMTTTVSSESGATLIRVDEVAFGGYGEPFGPVLPPTDIAVGVYESPQANVMVPLDFRLASPGEIEELYGPDHVISAAYIGEADVLYVVHEWLDVATWGTIEVDQYASLTMDQVDADVVDYIETTTIEGDDIVLIEASFGSELFKALVLVHVQDNAATTVFYSAPVGRYDEMLETIEFLFNTFQVVP